MVPLKIWCNVHRTILVNTCNITNATTITIYHPFNQSKPGAPNTNTLQAPKRYAVYEPQVRDVQSGKLGPETMCTIPTTVGILLQFCTVMLSLPRSYPVPPLPVSFCPFPQASFPFLPHSHKYYSRSCTVSHLCISTFSHHTKSTVVILMTCMWLIIHKR